MKNILLVTVFLFVGLGFTFGQGGNGFTCQEAACLSQNLGVTLNNGGSPPTPPLQFSCGVTHNNLFYSFCPESGAVTLDITPSNCLTGLGVQAIIYETDDCANFIEQVCISNGNVDPFTINFNGTPGQVYILMIDGFSGDVCDFTVVASGISDIQGPPLDPEFDPDVSLGVTLCEGEQLDIEITNDDDQECTAYFWEVRAGLGFVTLSENGTTATLFGQAAGDAEICVLVDNFCYEVETCFDVEITPPPMLDPIDDVITCETMVDFCDIYSGFFDPELNPDPFAEGWDISFHRTFGDAEQNRNPIACPYDLSGQTSHTIYVRVQTGSNCYAIQDFMIMYQRPEILPIAIDPVCDGPVDLSDLVPRDANGLQYTRVTIHEDEQDAIDGFNELIPPIIYESGTYWVRAETDFGCFDVEPIEVIIIATPEIEVEAPPPLCWTEFFEYNLDDLLVTELTGVYNPDDLDIRWFEFPPMLEDLDFAFINPKSTVYFPGCYYAVAVVELNARDQKYCMSNIVEICLDTVSPPTVEMMAIPPGCPEDATEIIFTFTGLGPFDVEYDLSNGETGFFFSTEDLVHVEEIYPDPFTDTICVTITFFEGADLGTEEDCEPVIGDPICIRPPQGGLLTLSQDTSICEGECANLIFTYTGTDSLTVVYSDGTNDFTINDLYDGYTEQVCPTDSTTYTLISAINPDDCEIDLDGSVTVLVNNPPTFTIEEYLCNGAQQYQATISISGGVPGTYTMDGTLIPPPNDTFITAWYGSNIPFTHLLDDVNMCGPITITGSENCRCPNRSGTMQQELLEICVGDIAIGTHNTDSVTFSDDNFYFALHDGNGTTLGTVVATNVVPEFGFVDPPMTTGTTYYISAVCGNDDGQGGIVLTDSCTQVSVGQPVIWYDLPTASLDGASTICLGDDITIPITLTGEAPFRIRIDTNGVLYDTILTNSGTYNFNFTPGGSPTVVTIPWMIDNIGCEGQGVDDYTVTLSPPPTATWTAECDDNNINFIATIVISGGSGNYTIDGNAVTSPWTAPPIPSGVTVTYVIDDDLGCGPIDVPVFRDCNCVTDPGTIEDTNLSLCIDETAELVQLLPQVLEPNDVGGYVLFTNRDEPFATGRLFFPGTTISFGMFPFVVGQTYYLAPVAGDEDPDPDPLNHIDDDNDDCARIGNIIELVWNPLPTVDFTGAEDICLTDFIDLDLTFTGSAPYDITYSVNNGPILNYTASSDNDLLRFDSNNYGPGSFDISLMSVTDNNGCVTSTNLVQTVVVNDTLDWSTPVAICDATQENYRVTFTITGGNGTYLVDGQQFVGTNFSYEFTSDWIPAGNTTYTFRVTDETGCDVDIITDMHDCDCPNPGIVGETLLELCEDEIAMVDDRGGLGVQLFLADTFEYILHLRDDGIRVGIPIQRSPDGSFAFDSNTMTFGTTYYISRMVGDDDGTGQVDLTDDCSEEVSNGQPVVWFANPVALIDGDPVITLNCTNPSVTLDASNSSSQGGLTFEWILENGAQTSSPLDGASISVSNPGLYILLVTTTGSPCQSRDTVEVLQDDEIPTVIIADPAILTCAVPAQTLDATGSSEGAEYQYTWTLPDGSTRVTVDLMLPISQPGNYILTINNTVNNCEQSFTVMVNEDFVFPEVDPGLGGEFDCHTDSILLAGSAMTGSGNFDVTWFRNGVPVVGATTESLVVYDGGWYTIEAIDPDNGCLSRDSVFVSADENVPTDALIQAFDPLCHDEQNGYVNIDSIEGGNLPYEYSINGGPFTLTPTFFNLGAGEYMLTVRDQNGCTWETTVTLNNPPPVEVDLGQDTTIMWGDTLDLIGNISNVNPTGEGQYDVDTIYITYVDSVSCTDCPNPTASVGPLTPTIYTITVITTDGCVASDTRRVNVEVLRPFFVPAAFSPNGDGTNDFLTIHMGNLEFVEGLSNFQLFDRWGEKITHIDEMAPARQIEIWDGRFDGQDMNPQVFVWTVEVEWRDGHKETFSGDVTLVR